MRFSVQKKIIILGAGLSLLILLVAFLTSFFIFENRSHNAFIKSIDNSIVELEHTIGNESSRQEMLFYYEEFYKEYKDHADDYTEEEFSKLTNEEKVNYFIQTYGDFYSISGTLGMSYNKLLLRTAFSNVSTALLNASISAGGGDAYAGFFVDSDDDINNDRFVYLFDSKLNISSVNSENYNGESHLVGEQYFLKDDDLDENPDKSVGGYVINGKRARVIDLVVGQDNDGNDVIITAFLEYDDSALNKDLGFFSLMLGLTLLASFIILIIFYILIARFIIVKNVLLLTKSTNEFTENIRKGNVNEVVIPKINSKDEIGLLSEAYITMEKEIIDYTKKIEIATREQEKINAELQVATNIQLESLPKHSLNDSNVLIEASIKSAKEVGGDFYDYFYIDENHLAIIISDVSGKGIPAALFMMKSKELIKSKLISKKSIEEVCYEVNNELLENNEAGLFITAFIGVLDIKTNILEFVNAGHEKPYLLTDGTVKQLKINSNFILGGINDFKYQHDVIELKENDRLFLHTDGLNESIDDNHQEFGYERILNCLNNNYNDRLSDILLDMNKELNSFTNNKDQFDDITMLILEIKSSKLEFNYTNPDLEIIEEVTNRFSDYYSYLNTKIIYSASIIIDELLNNYISYEKKDNLIIKISFGYNDKKLIIKFENNGDYFNPLEIKDKYIENEENLVPGGLGITMIKKFSSSVTYERVNDYNQLIVCIDSNDNKQLN